MYCRAVTALVVALCLSSHGMVAPTTSGKVQSPNGTEVKRKAVAYLLGWDSTLLIVEAKPSRRQGYLSIIKLQLRALGVRLKHPLAYYFHYPVLDQGLRAQSFADEVTALLKQKSPELADHFAVARDLLLILSNSGTSEGAKRKDITAMIPRLDIPRELQRLPDQDLLGWANDVHEYFDGIVSSKQRLNLGSLPSTSPP